jgi:hypothetical protein
MYPASPEPFGFRAGGAWDGGFKSALLTTDLPDSEKGGFAAESIVQV